MKTLRIFISSPSDVRPERVRAYDVITRLQTRYRAFLKLEAILWEDEAMRATASFQNQIVPPSATDIVICILWAKIGTRLPQDYKRPDGTVPTGTEWEFEDAYRSFQVKGTPDLLVYRKTTPPTVTVTSDDYLREWMQQKKGLDAFIDHWSRDHEGAFKAAFNSFKTDEEFEQKLEKHLEKVINDKLKPDRQTRQDEQAKAGITWFKGSPYLGLNAFQLEHAPVFFGRDLAINEITQRLLAQAATGRVFLMILGMSGCGKSSLARAGLLAELSRPAVIEKVGCWRWAILRPAEAKGTLIAGLAAALLGDKPALPELAALGFDAPKLAKLLDEAPTHALPLLEVALNQAAQLSAKERLSAGVKPARFVLLVDQLEEIFTLARFDAAQRTAFAIALSVLSRSGLVWVITTMRTDLYARCAEVAELVALKGDDGQYDLSPPTLSELGQMIRAPAAAAGLNFELQPATRQPLDDALYEEAGKNPEALPLLEFCLDELYKLKTAANLITWAAYQELGGLKGAITKRAEEVYTGLSPAARDALPAVLGALIAMGRTATARPAFRKSLASHPGGEEVVAAYVKASLFVTDTNQTGEAIVTLAHEALISGWTRVQTWLRENEDFLRVKARIAHAAQLWAEAGRERDFLLVEGKPLAEAEDALKKRRGELEPEEIEFVGISSRTAARSRRLRRYKAAAILTIGLSLIFGTALLKARQAAEAARLVTSATDSALATQELHKNNVREALAYLADALRNNPGNAQATALAISILRNSPLPLLSFRHGDEVLDVQFSDDGTRIVTASADGTAQLWETGSGARVGGPLQHKAQTWVRTAAFSPDSKWVVTASFDGTARIWDARTGAARLKAGTAEPIVLVHSKKVPSTRAPNEMTDTPASVISAIFNPSGQWVATTCANGKAYVWDATTGNPVLNPQSHEPVVLHSGNKPVWAAAFSPPDGRYLATASEDKVALLYDTLNGGKPRVLSHDDGGVNGVCFSPDGKLLVTGSDDGKARIWEVGSNADVRVVKHELPVVQPVFSPDSRWIVTSSNDKTARIWDARTGASRGKAMPHEGWVRISRFSQDGRLVATGSADGTARIWDAETGNPVSNPMFHGSAVYALNFSPDGRFLATASFDHYARVWPVQSTRVDNPMTNGVVKPKPSDVDKTTTRHSAINAALFSPDKKSVVTASADGTVRFWDANTRQATGEALVHGERAVTCISFSRPEENRLVTGSADDGLVRIWNTSTRRPEGDRMQHMTVIVAQFSPDGSLLATGSRDGSVRLWDAKTGRIKADKSMPNHSDEVTAITFSTDSSWILTASKDKRVMIWDVKEGKLLRELSHNNGVQSVVFRGDRILTASDDHSAQVWDARTGERIGRPMQHGAWIYKAEFSPDGSKTVTASADGTARVWDAITGLPLTDPMRHKNSVKTASFNQDGSRIVTGSVDGSARVWDTLTGQPVSVTLQHADLLTSASFSPDPGNELILTSSLDGTARLWGPVPTIKSAPDWLSVLLEYVGGLQLDSARNLVLTKKSAKDQKELKSAADLKELISRLPPVDDLSKFAHWLVENPATRPISPLTKIAVPEFVQARLLEKTPQSLKLAYEADPGNPLVLARLAESIAPTDPGTAESYCELALRRTRAGTDLEQTTQVKNIVRGLFPNLKELNAVPGFR